MKQLLGIGFSVIILVTVLWVSYNHQKAIQKIELGNLALKNEQFKSAMSSFQKALTLDPNNNLAKAGIVKAKKGIKFRTLDMI